MLIILACLLGATLIKRLLCWLVAPFLHTTRSAERMWEVDAMRGVAILAVVYYHIMFDLQYFKLLDITWSNWEWVIQAKIIKSTFLFLVGVSLALGIESARVKGSTDGLYIRVIKRSLCILFYAMLITLATSALPRGTIHFGILHAIAVSMILVYPLARFRLLLVSMGVVIIWLSFIIKGMHAHPAFIPFGLLPEGYYSVDYAPLAPNLGVVMLGLAIGGWFYQNASRRYELFAFQPKSIGSSLAFLGRHSLLIYLIHQPILFGIFYALDFIGLIQLFG